MMHIFLVVIDVVGEDWRVGDAWGGTLYAGGGMSAWRGPHGNFFFCNNFLNNFLHIYMFF
jgi:hypothetical protein